MVYASRTGPGTASKADGRPSTAHLVKADDGDSGADGGEAQRPAGEHGGGEEHQRRPQLPCQHTDDGQGRETYERGSADEPRDRPGVVVGTTLPQGQPGLRLRGLDL